MVTISAPPVTIFPTLGVEVEFDLTRLLYAGVNAKRALDHGKRVKRCLQCVGNMEAFCDRKWRVIDYTPGDDNCRVISQASRSACETNGPSDGKDDGISPRWITTEEECTAMHWRKQVEEQDPETFFGNQLSPT